MGIPSFYRHLCRRFPQIIGNGTGRVPPQWLCLDFNCAMYYVLRRQPAFPSESVSGPVSAEVSQWEANFQKDIASYMAEIILLVKPTAGVYVSCDGVVCAAKRRQQRLRRFKGPWMYGLENNVRRESGATDCDITRWDQNALTPGTAFMSKLAVVLKENAQTVTKTLGIPVIVSDTSEPGEGEHKLLKRMRHVSPATCAIYGLDADLILLGLLLEADTGATVSLVREAQEFESANTGGWRHMSIAAMRQSLLGRAASAAHVRDFVAGMSLLGNDFLPRSLTRTVRDDGIPLLIAELQEQWSQGKFLVCPEKGQIQGSILYKILESWAQKEADDMLAAVHAAARQATQPTGVGNNPVETAMKAFQAQPAKWNSISRLLSQNGKTLVPNWKQIYAEWRGHGAASAEDYLRGVGWVWDYYNGRQVCQGWMYDAHLPPLWSDIATALANAKYVVHPPKVEWNTSLPEWVHLLAVLPANSVDKLLPAGQRIINSNSWWWPYSWVLFDIGRTQLWECEVIIPIIPEAALRRFSQELRH